MNVIYEAAEVIETALADAYNFVVDNITKVANVALDMINSARNDTKIVFNTLYALGKITMER